MKTIRFYKEFGEYGYLATYSNYGFFKDGVFWKTSEHYYQAQKFLDSDVKRKIENAETPKIASNIGRDRSLKIRSDWEEVKQRVMFEAVYYKFKQNRYILKKLLATGDAEIVEATVKENYWGCGPNNDGQNNYGKILVRVREKLRKEQKEGNSMELISERGYEELCKEIENVDAEIIKTQREMGESAKRDNDLRENSEYMELRVKAMYTLPQKKQNLLDRIKNCKIIEETNEYKNFDGQIIVGSKIKLICDGEEETFTIMGDNEGDLNNDIISCRAPFAQALLGKHINETLNFNGMIIQIEEITKI